MKKDNEIGFLLLFAEIFLAFAVCIVLLYRLDWKMDEQRKMLSTTEAVTEEPTEMLTETPIPTFTPIPTPSPTPTPTPTPEPTPTPSPKPVESGHTFKPYTGYWAYDVNNSAQWRLQKVARTDERTGIRVVADPEGNERYCVALGTFWAGAHPEHIGRCVDVYMVNGTLLRCVLADVKQEKDTKGGKNRYGSVNNDILEFIVDEKYLPKNVNIALGGNGDVSGVGDEFRGDVKNMVVYDMWIEGFGK